MSENSEEGELEGMQVKGISATTGARCGAVQQNKGAEGEGGDEKLPPCKKIEQRAQFLSGKLIFLGERATDDQKGDGTQGSRVVSCSDDQRGEGKDRTPPGPE